MKNMKMKTKLILGYFIPIALTLFNIIIGNMSTQTAIHLTESAEQESYMRNSSIFPIVPDCRMKKSCICLGICTTLIMKSRVGMS